ncbi:MAG: hypothetical protein ACREMV_00935 [Gemmatimonadales bacterium]
MRLTGSQGKPLVLRDARIVGDSVIGFTDRALTGRSEHAGRVGVPLAQVTRAEARRFDAVKTIVVVGVVALLVVGLSNLDFQTTDPYH